MSILWWLAYAALHSVLASLWLKRVVAARFERCANLPDGLRAPLRRLLFSDELLDAAQPLPAGRRCLLVE